MWKAGDTRAVLDFLEHRQRKKQTQKTGIGGPGKQKTHSGALPPITTSATHPPRIILELLKAKTRMEDAYTRSLNGARAQAQINHDPHVMNSSVGLLLLLQFSVPEK